MKDVIFKKLVIQNFMSVGDESITIPFESGLNFITGWNKDAKSYNGVGKTTIINAFFFALFGTLYGDNSGKLKKADIVNNIVGGTPLVSLTFEADGTEYEVIRSVNPSKCKININGDGSNQKASIDESNKFICKVISGDSEVYSNTIVMDSDTSSFLLKSPEKKRKFIESVLGLEVFSEMLKMVKSDYTAKNNELIREQTKAEEQKRYLEKEIKNKNEWADRQKEKLDNNEKNKLVYEEELSKLLKESPKDYSVEIQELEKAILENSDRLVKGERAKSKAEVSYNSIVNEIALLKRDLVDPASLNCPTCKRPLEEHSLEDIEKDNLVVSEKISIKQTEAKESKEFLDKIIRGIATVTSRNSTNKSSLDKLKESQKKYSLVEASINEKQLAIKGCVDLAKQWNSEENPFVESVKNLKKEISEQKELVEGLEEEVEILDYVKYLCSPEGVKAHMVAKIVELFNAKLNYYINILGAPFTIEFDEFFEEKIKNANGMEVSYHSLSGGERKRVDLSMLFAFKDIRRMQSSLNINVTMLDELLDSALCSKGIEKSLEILQKQAEEHEETIFIITHRRDQIEDIGKTITLEKEKGVTKLIDIK